MCEFHKTSSDLSSVIPAGKPNNNSVFILTWWYLLTKLAPSNHNLLFDLNTFQKGAEDMESQFAEFLYRDSILWVTAFTLGGLAFAFGPIVIVYLLMPRQTRQIAKKNFQFIECGMDPIGDSWIRYGVVFYLYALIFLAFDVDVLFLFPVAVAYNNDLFASSIRDFIEIVIFVGILSLAVVYAWIKGVFKWERKTYLR